MSLLEGRLAADYPQEVAAPGLLNPAAASMARLLASAAYAGAKLVSCRRAPEGSGPCEGLFVDVEVEIGQRARLNDVRALERVAIIYPAPGVLPAVIPLRDDFPTDVSHLNVAGRGQPRSLCLFEMQPEEALRLATPFVLIERVRFWFKETAYGRLHGEDQPVDPIFLGAYSPVILPRDMGLQTDMLTASRARDRHGAPLMLETVVSRTNAESERMSVVYIQTAPLPHGRLAIVPVNVAELFESYDERGIDLVSHLRTGLRAWTSTSRWEQLRDLRCLLIVATPLERDPGRVAGVAAKAFSTACSGGSLAEQLGAFHIYREFAAPLLGQARPDMERLRRLHLVPMDVHRSLDRKGALAASGIAQRASAEASVLLAGAGALGSQVALTAARMGLGAWSVVDPDHLLPHNLARHSLSYRYLGRPKAEGLTEEINGLLGPGTANSRVCRIQDADAAVPLASAETVLDMTASVPAARWLGAVSRHRGRTCSVFLNPAGVDLVILAEGVGRVPRLDHVEMAYYWMLARGEGPNGHLSDGKVGLYPSGGCRSPSLAISQADLAALAPVAVKRILQFPLPDHGFVEIVGDGSRGPAVVSRMASSYSEADVGGWQVSVSLDVIEGVMADRRASGSNETGGILVGTWDRLRKRAYVVGRFCAPPDSDEGPDAFVRDAEGVFQTLEELERLTARNLTYIGEWHTHPLGYGSRPSEDDRTLLRWIGDALTFSDVPALMMICGSDGIRLVLGPDTATSTIIPSGPVPNREGEP